jgi:CheY-like chemotaxis protein
MDTGARNSLAFEEQIAANKHQRCSRRILLVDDQRSVREAIGFLLRLDGYAVIEAMDGALALDMFLHEHFDLVITDLEMPNMKGTELAARIKQVSPRQPIVMITAYAERLRGTSNPVDAILDKPFQLKDLRRVLTLLLN